MPNDLYPDSIKVSVIAFNKEYRLKKNKKQKKKKPKNASNYENKE